MTELKFFVRTENAPLMNAGLKMNPGQRRREARNLRQRTKNTVLAKIVHYADRTDMEFNLGPVEVEIQPHRKNACDIDACSMMVKPVLDGIVDAGLIPDDSLAYVQRLILTPAVKHTTNGLMVRIGYAESGNKRRKA